MDNKVLSVKFNGASLSFSGEVNTDWRTKHNTSFVVPSDNLGKLEIKGEDANTSENCKWGGLLMHCTTNDTSSPWHNFVSDDANWKDEYNMKPCQNSDGIMAPPLNTAPILKFFRDKGSKKIWADRKIVTLTGGP